MPRRSLCTNLILLLGRFPETNYSGVKNLWAYLIFFWKEIIPISILSILFFLLLVTKRWSKNFYNNSSPRCSSYYLLALALLFVANIKSYGDRWFIFILSSHIKKVTTPRFEPKLFHWAPPVLQLGHQAAQTSLPNTINILSIRINCIHMSHTCQGGSSAQISFCFSADFPATFDILPASHIKKLKHRHPSDQKPSHLHRLINRYTQYLYGIIQIQTTSYSSIKSNQLEFLRKFSF